MEWIVLQGNTFIIYFPFWLFSWEAKSNSIAGKTKLHQGVTKKRKVKSDEIFRTPNMVNQPPKMCKIWPSGSRTDMQNQLKTLLKLCTRRNKTNWYVVLIDFRTLRPVYSVPAYLLCVCEVYKDVFWSIKKEKEGKNSMIILAHGPTEYFLNRSLGSLSCRF